MNPSVLTTRVLPAVIVLTTSLLPAVADDEAVQLKQRQASVSNLKDIGMAFWTTQEALNRVPTDITDKEGKPLLSWRVVILQHLQWDSDKDKDGKSLKVAGPDLYKQFKLDEPWDSEHNKKLIKSIPRPYVPVRGKAEEGETYYQAFHGEHTVLGGKTPPKTFDTPDVPDGSRDTGLVFEAGDPVVWTKPGGMPFDPTKKLPKLGGMFDGRFHVLCCDGSVWRSKEKYDEDELYKFIMPDDGKPIDFKKLLENR